MEIEKIDFGPIPEYVKQSSFRFVRACWLKGRGVYWQGKVGEKITGDNLVDVWVDITPPGLKESEDAGQRTD